MGLEVSLVSLPPTKNGMMFSVSLFVVCREDDLC